MGGAQPLAVTMNGGVAICIDCDASRIARRIEHGYLDVPRTPPVPDRAKLDTYERVYPSQHTWWRERLTRVRALPTS